MPQASRPVAFWIFIVFLVVSTIAMLAGQTMAIVDYDLAVSMGLQESPQEVGEYGIEVNRAFGAGDTVVYVPLMVASLAGLILRKRWSLITTAASVGVSAYWSATIGFMLAFLPGAAGYTFAPGPEIWIFIGAHTVFGVWGLFYLVFRGEELPL